MSQNDPKAKIFNPHEIPQRHGMDNIELARLLASEIKKHEDDLSHTVIYGYESNYELDRNKLEAFINSLLDRSL